MALLQHSPALQFASQPAQEMSRATSTDDAPAHEALSALEPDAFAAICDRLQPQDVASLASSSIALRHAVNCNDRLWGSLYARLHPEPWQRLTRPPQQQQHSSTGIAAVAPGAWRDIFLRTQTACQQLCSTGPISREFTTDTLPVHHVSIHGRGPRRLIVAAQGGTIEIRGQPSSGVAPACSIQCHGHTARVSAAAVVDLGGVARRTGIITTSHDQTVRLWAADVEPAASDCFDHDSSRLHHLRLVTPLRTLRGHNEAVTSLQMVAGSAGVTIAATGSKDRTVRLWGLSPLLDSPVHKPQIATLRGHGAPITCLAMSGGSASGSISAWEKSSWDGISDGGLLLSGSLDSRVKAWDPWTAACTGTAKCAAPVLFMQPVAACPALQPHGLLVSTSSAVQLLDLRSFKAVATAALPDKTEYMHCLKQHGWDLAIGSSDGARVIDLRLLSSSPSAASKGSRGLPERLHLGSHLRHVTSIHIDRLKVVTATDRHSDAPVHVWCIDSGECLAELPSCLPASGGHGDLEEQQAAAAEAENRGREGVTALACRGSVLVTGSSDGAVVERDWSQGGLPELESRGGEAGTLAGKFWQYDAV